MVLPSALLIFRICNPPVPVATKTKFSSFLTKLDEPSKSRMPKDLMASVEVTSEIDTPAAPLAMNSKELSTDTALVTTSLGSVSSGLMGIGNLASDAPLSSL